MPTPVSSKDGIRNRLINNLTDVSDTIKTTIEETEKNEHERHTSNDSIPVLYYPGRFFTISNCITGLYTHSVVRSNVLLVIRILLSLTLCVTIGVLYGIIIPDFDSTCCYDTSYVNTYDFGACNDKNSQIYTEPAGYGVKKQCDVYNTTILVFDIVIFSVLCFYIFVFVIEFSIYRTYVRYISGNVRDLSASNDKTEVAQVVNMCFGFIGKHDNVLFFAPIDTFSPFYLYSYGYNWVSITFYYVIFIGMVLSLNILIEIDTKTTCNNVLLRTYDSIYYNALYAAMAFLGAYMLFLLYIVYEIYKSRSLSENFNDSEIKIKEYVQSVRNNTHYK